MIQHVLDIAEAVALSTKIKDHPGVEQPAPRRHDQTVKRAEARRRLDADTFF